MILKTDNNRNRRSLSSNEIKVVVLNELPIVNLVTWPSKSVNLQICIFCENKSERTHVHLIKIFLVPGVCMLRLSVAMYSFSILNYTTWKRRAAYLHLMNICNLTICNLGKTHRAELCYIYVNNNKYKGIYVLLSCNLFRFNVNFGVMK